MNSHKRPLEFASVVFAFRQLCHANNNAHNIWAINTINCFELINTFSTSEVKL